MTIDREWVLNFGRETEQKLREFFRLNPQERGDFGLPLARWLALYLWGEEKQRQNPGAGIGLGLSESCGTLVILFCRDRGTMPALYAVCAFEGVGSKESLLFEVRRIKEKPQIYPELYDANLPLFVPLPKVSDRSDTPKKPYVKPAIADLSKPTERDISRRFEEMRAVVERVRGERCPSGCSLTFDRTVIAGDPRILICIAFKLGAWTFEHRETRILASMKQPNAKEDAEAWKSNASGFEVSMRRLFDRAAADFLFFSSKAVSK